MASLEVDLLRNEFQMWPLFSQNLAIQGAFETATQKNKEIKIRRNNDRERSR